MLLHVTCRRHWILHDSHLVLEMIHLVLMLLNNGWALHWSLSGCSFLRSDLVVVVIELLQKLVSLQVQLSLEGRWTVRKSSNSLFGKVSRELLAQAFKVSSRSLLNGWRVDELIVA